MNILYISHLSTNIAAGLNWSVPASVNAQQQYDNVLWINRSDYEMIHWKEVCAYHSYKDFGKRFSLKGLPLPFSKPDLVVFEGFYYLDDPILALELRRKHIPYIIVPRSSLTKQALINQSKWKKRIAHLLIFNDFIKNAAGIQYLTDAEYCDSGENWNKNNLVIPNGFNIPNNFKTKFNTDKIKCVFIGRLDFYQKGLDLLIEACSNIHDVLRDHSVSIDIYGPRRYDWDKIHKYIEERNLTDLIFVHDEIVGESKEKVLLDADVFILPSRFEGHPMGLVEALAYGLPCLVTTGSNMKKEVNEYDAGWTALGNRDSIEEALLNMVKDRDKFLHKSKNAKSLAGRYDWHMIAEDTHKKFHNLLIHSNH